MSESPAHTPLVPTSEFLASLDTDELSADELAKLVKLRRAVELLEEISDPDADSGASRAACGALRWISYYLTAPDRRAWRRR